MSVGRQTTIVSDDDQIEERRNLVTLFPRDARPRIESTSVERFALEGGRARRSGIVVFLGSSPQVEAEAKDLPVEFERHGARYHRQGEVFVLTAKTPALLRQKDLRALQNELGTLEDGLFGVGGGVFVRWFAWQLA